MDANAPPWSPEATQVRLDYETLRQKTLQALGIVPSSKMIQLGPRANPAGAATGNKDDANDGDCDDESVASTEPEATGGLRRAATGRDTGEETLTRATVGSTKETRTTTAAPVSTPTSPSPSASAPASPLSGGTSGDHRQPRQPRQPRRVLDAFNAVNQVKIIRYLKTLRPAPAAILLQEHHLSYKASREGLESAWPGACIRFSPHVLTLIPDGSPLAGHLLSSTPVVFAGAPRFDGRILRSVFRLEELDAEIINMYAPVQEDDRRDFFELLHFNAPRPKTLRILADDLNDYLAVKNRVQGTRHGPTCPSKLHPAFTRSHYRGRGEERKNCSRSRIDSILVQCSLANRLLSASKLFDAPCSDHRPVVADLLSMGGPPLVPGLEHHIPPLSSSTPSFGAGSRPSEGLARGPAFTRRAFADDAVVVVESPAALSKLRTPSQTWYAATNGKTNTDKTLGENFKWCGYAFFRHGDSKLFWTHVLNRIQARTRAAGHPTLSPSGRVFYANARITSTIMHTALTDFVWGGPRRNTVARDFVFQTREHRGLGLISIDDIVHSVALRFWDAVAGSDEAILAPLPRESWRSLVAATRDLSRPNSKRFPNYSRFRHASLHSTDDVRYAYEDEDAVEKWAQIADLYWRDNNSGWALFGHRSGFWKHSKEPALQHEHLWSREAPRPRCFNFFGLSRPFTIRKRFDTQRFWRWLHDGFASVAEQDTHWPLMYDVTSTRKLQHIQGHASSPSCLFCGNDSAVIATVSHYFFECAYSTSFWGGVLRILFDKLSIEDTDVDPSTFTPEQLTMGFPLLRVCGRTTSNWMWVRLACAIGFQRLHLLRWRVHQRFELDNVVAPSSLPSALRAFERDFLSRAGFVPGARDWEV
ncbi:BZ3500_MvSof-1268-A1-R1_Chr5-1g07589 [Microbotryum saponariae]|uniref:BZ3500_MvSof-1268-A1-R1_Chr5-1g07589 protein n=1 Tax=Microbotryum saponariae TaxID=289078 RepID=A0A2X0KZ49_9BASI|nr:BZ3500_MvSof-1268-A1-R1_Chr5-1g07589 [Microbotryum saponariae]SDA05460.1 BZ3501_MvSof-1269-A2-R1_Chr5-2g07413 [Microbotryum saponariae]